MDPKILIMDGKGLVVLAVYIKPTPQELADYKARYPRYADELQRQFEALEG